MPSLLPAKVLIVDDEPLIRVYARDIVEEAGCTATEAKSADEALRILEVDGYSAVLTDIEMPGSKNGIALAWDVRARWPQTKVIIMSGKYLPQPEGLPHAAQFIIKAVLG
jgi:YesN/AraC family two-component response regulator